MLTLKKALFVAAAAILLVAGYFAARNQGAPHAHLPDGTLAAQQAPAPVSATTAMSQSAVPAAAQTSAASGHKAFEVRIPADPNAGIPVYRLHNGDKVSFSAASAIDGKLAIHGITQDIPVRENQTMQFEVQAEHTGRFPMHVHGRDGSHLEVGVVEILPQ